MTEEEKSKNDEIQTIKEQTMSSKPNNIMINKIRGKTFVTRIYFDQKSKATFQDKLLKVIHSERKK